MRTELPFIVYKGKEIHPGHPCRVESSPGKQDGFDTVVRRIWGDPVRRTPPEIDVIDPHNGHWRTFPVTRIRPYLRNVDAIRERILTERRKKLGFFRDAAATPSGSKKAKPGGSRARSSR